MKDLQFCGQFITESCGGHIHIGANYLTSKESWENLIELWCNTEGILYIICNAKGEIPREAILEVAAPISGNMEKILANGTVQLNSEEDVIKLAKDTQKEYNGRYCRYFAINFLNLGSKKNTIEFRIANGTMTDSTWIENINLFGGIIKTAEELGKIQNKCAENQTPEEIEKLKQFEQIKDSKITEEEKLEKFLSLVISEENNYIYIERYYANREEMKLIPEIKKELEEELASKPISIKQIGEKTFFGRKAITKEEYNQIIMDINRILTEHEKEKDL